VIGDILHAPATPPGAARRSDRHTTDESPLARLSCR
jgi:hypothetical protein